jgi:hypothetical protein
MVRLGILRANIRPPGALPMTLEPQNHSETTLSKKIGAAIDTEKSARRACLVQLFKRADWGVLLVVAGIAIACLCIAIVWLFYPPA